MRHWYLDSLAVIHREVGTSPFTLSAVRPALKAGGFAVNGSVLMEMCENGYMVVGEDLHVRGTHYVHQYRISRRGEEAAARRAAVPVAATC
jgi:hypothetical protein